MGKLKINNSNSSLVVEHTGAAGLELDTLELAKLKEIGTIADLRAMTSMPGSVYVSGYHSEGDGAFGSQFFRWNATSTDDDNGGTVIKVTGEATGRYELQYDGAVNVRWFGAVGGELHEILALDIDNTPYIKAAIDSLPLLGGEVFIGEHYQTKTTIELFNHIGVSLVGTGCNTSSSIRCTEDVTVIHVKGVSAGSYYGFGMRNLWVSGYKQADGYGNYDGTYPVLKMETTYLTNITDSYFEDGGYSLYLDDIWDSSFTNLRLEGPNNIYATGVLNSSTFSNIWALANSREGDVEYAIELNNVTSVNTAFDALMLRSNAGTRVLSIVNTDGLTIQDVTIKNGYSGIVLEDSNNITIMSCNSHSGESSTIGVPSGFNAVKFEGTCDNIIVNNLTCNYLKNIYQSSGTVTNSVISVVSNKDITTKQTSREGLKVRYLESNKSSIKAGLSASQNFTSTGKVLLDTTLGIDDNYNKLELTAANTIRALSYGRYFVIANLDFRFLSTDTTGTVTLRKNGGTVAVFEGSATTNTTVTPNGAIMVELDYYDELSVDAGSIDGNFDIHNSRTFLQVIEL
jgi:hypothetical protein